MNFDKNSYLSIFEMIVKRLDKTSSFLFFFKRKSQKLAGWVILLYYTLYTLIVEWVKDKTFKSKIFNYNEPWTFSPPSFNLHY